ncbi:iron(III) transport system permease protein [Leifsonia sp. 98AMF]|uniref:ABC transporter permease n=1 Tax=unclassified Leifsonia TaxID=2663824 RepID=UPI0008797FB5|nr:MULTISPECIES: ABC transporter permease subunit [unclassified Leifsonia]SDH61861.1 iron(III) transport system permease protein [Leifsonia sp. 197AMF]SDI77267.1 iron(III) transport system permease protein [Leifsonia sp. 466MF]SDK09641.1 iron(III) transport system permease protein [Leifsonia sp. 157MF]SDN80653.1 iron(III) transport system permease protein [Leifsonia sp. 509MF]SEN26752.1 iron(III) transport system permease protein [Leifsonia sp. 467MF]
MALLTARPARPILVSRVGRIAGVVGLVAIIAWFLVTFLYWPNLSIIHSALFPPTGSFFDTIHALAASEQVQSALTNTIIVAVVSVVTVNIVGIAQAFLLEAFHLRAKAFFAIAFAVPLVFGSVSAVTGYAAVYGSNGLLTHAMLSVFPGIPPNWFSGILAVILVHTFTMTGYHFLFLRPAIRRVDFSLVEAARSLGVRPIRALASVVLPVLRPTLLAAVLMVFIAAVGSFAAPNILGGGHFTMIGPLIQALTAFGRPDMSAVLGLGLGILTAALLVLVLRTERRAALFAGAKSAKPFQPLRIHRSGARVALYGAASILAVINLAPLVTTLLMSLSSPAAIRNGSIGAPTLENYIHVFTSSAQLGPLLNSLLLCAIAIPAALVLGVAVTHLTHRKRGLIPAALQASLLLPYFLPGVLLALGFLIAFGASSALVGGQVLVGGFWILPLAYTVALLPTVFRFVRADYASMDPALDEAARSLGATGLRRFRTIMLPLLIPVLLQVAALGFNSTFDEYTISVLLYNINSTPFGVALGTLAATQDPSTVGISTAYVVISTLIALTMVIVADRMSQRASRLIGGSAGA